MSNLIRITGGKSLHGEVMISGSKNAVSTIIPALCLLNNQYYVNLTNIPNISDISTLCSILEETGVEANIDMEKKTVSVRGNVKNNFLSEKFVPQIRASSLFLGALLAMTGEVHMPFSGGDKIGVRPLDIHFYVFEKFKIKTTIDNGYIHCHATEFPLKNATIYLRYPSVGATENAILLATKAEGTTYIYNAACEPEITDLAVALNNMGAKITGAGTPIIRIVGVKELQPVNHEVIPDRLELCTFLLAIACTHGKGTLIGGIPEHCISVLHTLEDAGVKITYDESTISVDATMSSFKPINIHAMPYPGIPTDVQPLLSVFASQCSGNSVVHDSVFKDRFAYVNEFEKMGVHMLHIYDYLSITGPQVFKSATVRGNDIRAASSLVLAALLAEEQTTVLGYEHIHRGYEHFDDKLRNLGADVCLGN